MRRSSTSRFRTLLLAGSAALALSPTLAMAQPQPRAVYNIPAGDLGAALTKFGEQSEREIVFSADLTRDRRAGAVSGEMSSGEALGQLLAGSGLTYRTTSTGSIIVEVAADPQSSGAAGDGAEVEALIVTAQKREEDIQDVPIAISAFTQEALERSQIAGGPDLMTQVPNMTFTKTNFTGYSIQLRGIGTQAISATTDAAVAVSFNNTSFIRNRFFEQEFYDLQRVEVLRGPQGTLYGRNATAGVVNLISQKPKFTYEAKLSGDVSNYSSTRLEAMVNVPLVEDKVSLRLAGAWTKREGFVTNELTGNPIDGRDLWSTRLSFRFSPTDRLDANLIWEHFQEDDDRLRSGKQLCHQDDRTLVAGLVVDWIPGKGYNNNVSQGCIAASLYSPDSFEAPNGYSLPYYLPLYPLGAPVRNEFNPYASLVQSPDLRVIESTIDPKYRANSDLVELQFSYDFSDNLTLTSETAYNRDTIYSLEDYNRFNTASGAFTEFAWFSARGPFMHQNEKGFWEFCDPQIGCADRVVAMDVSSAKSSQFSQEFRVSSDFDGAFNFSLGANYLRYDTEDKYYVFINTLTMTAVATPQGTSGDLVPWQQNGVDSSECLPEGAAPPDPTTYAVLRGCTYIDPNPIESVNDRGHNYFLSRNPYKLISYAAFGEAYWNVTENLKITAGLRVTRDKKQAPRIPSWLLAAQTVGLSVLTVENQEWTEPTGRLTVDWKPDLGFTDETLLYASLSRGYKAGGSNPPPSGVVAWGFAGFDLPEAQSLLEGSAAKPKTFDPEFVNALEVGSKNTLLDGRLTLNLAGFYYDYTGYQVSQIIDRSAVNYNFDAKIWGLELEADWRPVENLRFGFKGGYEKTRVADGERAIDIMDRTGGRSDWVVYRPFPSFPSNCVFPSYVIDPDGDGEASVWAAGGGYMGPCEFAYAFQLDPATGTDYGNDEAPAGPPDPFTYPNYPGYNPRYDVGQNNGEGFYKDLGGNELPNAPHFTATVTADYTLPLSADWLMTLHTDLYYQSEAWTRVFNTEGYDKLKAYTNVNLAAIFTNEDAGWKVMAYVKNIFDRDSITGAFLNSDDTGLTTNVFLTEPRLYGLRVTKEFQGGPWWTGSRVGHKGPFPLWIELGGTVIRQDAPYATLEPNLFNTFQPAIDPTVAQHRDLDWGDSRQIRVTYKPAGSDLSLQGEARFGEGNSGMTRVHQNMVMGPPTCPFAADSGLDFLCNIPGLVTFADSVSWSDSASREAEEHTFASLLLGKDLAPSAWGRSTIRAGLHYAQFQSTTSAVLDGIPNMNIPTGWGYDTHPRTFDHYRSTIQASRGFEGVGPTLSWDGTRTLLGSDAIGNLDVDWSIAAGAVFGRQRTAIDEDNATLHVVERYDTGLDFGHMLLDVPTSPIVRSKSTTAPFVDLSLGLSYEIQRIKIGAGYRWERYFDVLDAGYAEHKDYDRTIDGPYFKLAIGFGG